MFGVKTKKQKLWMDKMALNLFQGLFLTNVFELSLALIFVSVKASLYRDS